MTRPASAVEIERRALALFEALSDVDDRGVERAQLTRGEPPEVLQRLSALEATAAKSTGSIPTLSHDDADDDEAPPPRQLGPFRLVQRVGRGGMGEVWEAERADDLFEQRVAVKFIQRRLLRRAGRPFEDERRFLARLEHPGITRLIDGGVTDDGLPWLAMEFVQGRQLDTAFAGLPLAGCVALLVEAAQAVAYAHDHGIVHGDLKPANILVTDEGRVKLLDFGIGRIIGAPDQGGAQPVTRAFASPERLADGAPSVADDLFALGCTLRPIAARHRDRELAAIVARATASAGERYPAVPELIEDLSRWQTGRPVHAVGAGLVYRTRKLVVRHPWWLVAAGLLLILLGSASLVAHWNGLRAARRTQEVRQLAGMLLFRLYDDLARQPGTAGQRAQLAEKATRYLDELASTEAPTVEERLDTVRGYRRLAAVEGLPGTPNLGDPAAAGRALDRAASLLTPLARQRPDDPRVLNEHGWLSIDRWSLNAGSAGRGRHPMAAEASRLFNAALSHAPSLAEARLGLITAQRNHGYELLWTDDRPHVARTVLNRALAQWRSQDWPRDLRDRAALLEIALLNRLGDATYYDHDISGALQLYRSADRVVDLLIATTGQVPQLILLKGENAFNISGTLQEVPGREAEALAIARTGDALLRTLLASGTDAAAEKRLLVLKGQEAELLTGLHRYDEALNESEASAALRRARLARSPGDPQRLRDLAIGLAPHARLLDRVGRRGDACAAAREAVEGWRGIKALGQLGALDARKNLPDALGLVAKMCAGAANDR